MITMQLEAMKYLSELVIKSKFSIECPMGLKMVGGKVNIAFFYQNLKLSIKH